MYDKNISRKLGIAYIFLKNPMSLVYELELQANLAI